MGTTLSGKTPATTFDALIKVGDNSALTTTLKTISDGLGNDSPLKLSTDAVGVGSITNIETEIGGKQATLVSGTNIKTINSSSLLGSGDVAVQETLVSGTNIKTINGSSLVGSGDISVSASPAGSNTQIQFNDSGAFGADSLFNWDNTNKRLGVGTTTPDGRIHIIGSGTTSGSTSLLVENSAGNELFKLTDDGNINLGEPGAGPIISAAKNSGKSLKLGNQAHLSSFDLIQFKTWNGLGYNEAMRITGNTDQFIGIGQSVPTAKVHIKGSGATSSTTALLVENSSGTDLLKVVDNGQVLVDVQSIAAGAKVQIDSTTQGFLPPRMTTTQVNAIEGTAGLIVYDTTTNKLKCYDGSSWNNLF